MLYVDAPENILTKTRMGLQDSEVVEMGSSDEETTPKKNSVVLQDIILQARTALKDKCFG